MGENAIVIDKAKWDVRCCAFQPLVCQGPFPYILPGPRSYLCVTLGVDAWTSGRRARGKENEEWLF